MPFTIAHTAAVLPVHHCVPRWTIPAALVIGSITPDVAYFAPLGVNRGASHTVPALVWFCLPVGLALYVVFQYGLKRPLLSLAPAGLRRRVRADVPPLAAATIVALVLSLLVGAATHIAWDACTHRSGAVVQALDVLRMPLGSVGSYQVYVYKLLQHGSSALGCLILVWWLRRWWMRTPAAADAVAPLAAGQRRRAVAFLFLVPVAYAVTVAAARALAGGDVPHIVGRGTLGAFSGFGAALLAFGLWWHLATRGAEKPVPPARALG